MTTLSAATHSRDPPHCCFGRFRGRQGIHNNADIISIRGEREGFDTRPLTGCETFAWQEGRFPHLALKTHEIPIWTCLDLHLEMQRPNQFKNHSLNLAVKMLHSVLRFHEDIDFKYFSTGEN